LKEVPRPKVSATAVENGNTVEEPTTVMLSRAKAWVAQDAVRAVVTAAIRVFFIISLMLGNVDLW
jgi:hypothetical protein